MSLLRNSRSIVGIASRVRSAPKFPVNAIRLFSSSTPAPKQPESESNDDDALADGEKLLYKQSQMKPILIMLGVSGVNAMYFGSQLVNYAMYKDVVVEGLSLAGDPLWGGVGSLATLGILYFTRVFAHNSVYQAYETEDHQRVGFQMHTVLGKPGRKFEVPIGNVRFIQKVNQITRTKEEMEAIQAGFINKIFQSSYVPMAVNGFDGNVIVDMDGDFKDKARLVELINEPEKVLKEQAKEVKIDTPNTVPITNFRQHRASKLKR